MGFAWMQLAACAAGDSCDARNRHGPITQCTKLKQCDNKRELRSERVLEFVFFFNTLAR